MIDVRLAASPQEAAGAAALAAAVFGDIGAFWDDGGRLRVDDVVVAVDGDDVIGTIRLADRTISRADVAFATTFLGYVCVDPRRRGEGAAGRMVTHALEAARARGSILGMVIARRAVDGWYPRYGVHGVAAYPRAVVRPRGGGAGVELLPAPDGVLGAWAAQQAAVYRATFGWVERDLVASALAEHRLRNDGVIEEVHAGGRCHGYVARSGSTVHEIVVPDIEGGAVVDAIAARAGADAVKLLVAPEHPILASLRDHDVTMSIRRCAWGGQMTAIVDPASALRVLEARVHARATQLALPPRTESRHGLTVRWDGSAARAELDGREADADQVAAVLGAAGPGEEPTVLDSALAFHVGLGDEG